MKRKKKNETALLVEGISEYLEGKKQLDNFTFICTPEGHFYIENGKRVPRKVFENAYPLVQLQSNQINKGKHIDSRYIE